MDMLCSMFIDQFFAQNDISLNVNFTHPLYDYNDLYIDNELNYEGHSTLTIIQKSDFLIF